MTEDQQWQKVEIEKPVYGGAFLARIEGRAVFVPLALPGEQAQVRIVENKSGYATAELVSIDRAAPERIAPRCPYFGACGGCNYQHTDYATQIEFKKAILRETLERGGVELPVEIEEAAGEPWGYRNRIRLAFEPQGNVGYRGRRSNAFVRIEECPIAAPLLVRAALAAGEVAREVGLESRWTEILLFCNAEERALLATVFTPGGKVDLDRFGRELQARVPELNGLELATDGRPGKPARTLARWGAESIKYRAAEFEYRVDQGAFFQVNRWMVDDLVERATAGYEGGTAWDLYAGVGLFARRLTRGFKRVVAVESAPAATKALAENLRGTAGVPVRSTTLEFLRGQAKTARPDLVVVDPPRTGLGAETCKLLAETGSRAVTYVSCDPATMARDLKMLASAGFRMVAVTLVDLFPQTFHLESVVRLRRD